MRIRIFSKNIADIVYTCFSFLYAWSGVGLYMGAYCDHIHPMFWVDLVVQKITVVQIIIVAQHFVHGHNTDEFEIHVYRRA